MALFGKDNKKTTQAAPAKTEAVSMQDLYNEVPAAKGKAAKQSATKAVDAKTHRVLVSPLITEKATNLTTENKYVFIVDRDANKIAVAKAIQAVYGVSPVSVNIVNVSGKRVSRGRIRGQRNDWRKAIVTLKKGESIKIYEGV
jgi:large subunit ribosomal protein L23